MGITLKSESNIVHMPIIVSYYGQLVGIDIYAVKGMKIEMVYPAVVLFATLGYLMREEDVN